MADTGCLSPRGRHTSRSLTTLANGSSFRVIETRERRTAAFRAERERRRIQDCVQLGANRHPKGLDAMARTVMETRREEEMPCNA